MVTGSGYKSTKMQDQAARINTYPPVTVVMATYNGAPYISRQIESILQQTLTPATIIVCDDASTDGTTAILEQYQQKGLLQLHVNEKQLGVVANFKKAVSLAPADHYISLADQDDEWLPEKLEKSLKLLQTIDTGTKPAMVYSDLILTNQDGHLLNPSFQNELGHDRYIHSLETLLFGNFVLGCTTLFNPAMRSCFGDIPLNKAYNHDTWITLIAFSFGQEAFLPEPTVRYRKHQGNVTLGKRTKTSRANRILVHLKGIMGKGSYLKEQFILVRDFLAQYRTMLGDSERTTLEQFLQLENKPHIKKKIAFEKAFSNKWLKRFA